MCFDDKKFITTIKHGINLDDLIEQLIVLREKHKDSYQEITVGIGLDCSHYTDYYQIELRGIKK